jgi:hypothetical protein
VQIQFQQPLFFSVQHINFIGIWDVVVVQVVVVYPMVAKTMDRAAFRAAINSKYLTGLRE